MSERLYSDLAPWWPLLSPPSDYDEEAVVYLAILAEAAERPLRSVLELGCGGGHLACHFPASLDVQLLDLSPTMLACSRALNPSRVHHQADMRSVRLGRQFDAVLLHDAVEYMTTPDDLRAALETAAAHCVPGGVLLVLPDTLAETFEEGNSIGGGDAPDGRSARFMEWRWDPDPHDGTYQVDFAFMLRGADGAMKVVHDQHTMGLHPMSVWQEAFERAGFELLEVRVPESVQGLIELGHAFLARRR